MRRAFDYAALSAGLAILFATPAQAQSSALERCRASAAPATRSFARSVAADFKRLPSKETAIALGAGALTTYAAHFADDAVANGVADSNPLHETFKSGSVIGLTPFQMSASALTFAIGRATNSPCAATVGAELFRAQLMAEVLTRGLKRVVRRDRPEGTGRSFPSGHTAVSFASATVIQQRFGWRVGAGAYAAATYVAASRVQARHHYLSDVAFGAALGFISGRTVTFGARRQYSLEPVFAPGGAGVQISVGANRATPETRRK